MVSKKEFQDAISYLTSQGQLPVSFERVIEPGRQKVWDMQFDSNGNLVSQTDVTPDVSVITQALVESQAQILKQNAIRDLRKLSRSDALNLFRNRLISANGNAQSLLQLYTSARNYETQNTDLQALMTSKRLIRETALGRNLNLSTNQDKAIYMELFESALVLIAIDEE
ncbi:MAG: hypothetical protein ACPG7F_12900 [Aggregatilineales bacterium]